MSLIVGYEEQVREGQGPEEAPEVLGNDNQEKEEEVCKWSSDATCENVIEDLNLLFFYQNLL